jgi:NADH-quinone oxidoreductase subunit E
MVPELVEQPNDPTHDPRQSAVDPALATRVVDESIERRGCFKHQLISVLQDVQRRFNYLPRPALEAVAARLEISAMQVYSAATFFSAFSLEPRGEKVISVCMGTACHVRGAPPIAEAFERKLGIGAGQTTADGRYTLLCVGCLGACALGPVVDVNGEVHGNMNVQKADKLMERLDQEDRRDTR